MIKFVSFFSSEYCLLFIDSFDNNFEKETFFDGTTTINREINYIFAPDGLIAIYENKNGIGKMFYTATDNLGFLFFFSIGSAGYVESG